ncbi:MAG: TOBE domain-containing protein [Thermodesulfobacteriota bacterium]
MFKGQSVDYIVELKNGETITASRNVSDVNRLERGDTVYVGWNTRMGHAFRE